MVATTSRHYFRLFNDRLQRLQFLMCFACDVMCVCVCLNVSRASLLVYFYAA